ncbi:monovalent cation/H+ antiporter subunit A [Corticimicrobacter populi]|uniref:Monovalent cation/H+ antiporter subunit A n=1 Tax=Corticimicrobacter populi TaxID=2175229 RepID=A0A2V1JXC1_9BURK|nr:monovalent cation/H+ antiporter subunit A [Corticimicrobacter populi]PWF20880.1 monovalent cation/H+ antiporter subunit A [Corticimicrobacter populi]
MLLISLIVLPFIGSLIAALFPANARNVEAWLAGLISLAALILTILAYPDVTDGGVLRQEYAWLPERGMNFILRMDGFAWLFSLLITGIGLLVVVYARYYMSPEDPVPRFFSFFLAFMGAMLGLVLSGNLIQIALFWELTSLVSFLLIGYWHHNPNARRGARMALTVTATGGLCLFGGLLILGHMAGSYDLDVVLSRGAAIREHALYTPALILILLGALTKSAQVPFQFWLPHAMAAPTPVSAYLHSATMVKAGVFLLARFWPVLAGTDEWFWIVSVAGLATLLLGAYAAIFQQDLKGLLAYSTISHLGLITLLLGMNSTLAAVAAIFHIMNHATFKASLFMAAGIIDHETGTRDIRRLSGLRHAMPYTATLAMVASAAMAGVPLLNGFISKEMFFAETVVVGHVGPMKDFVLPLCATIASMFSVAYSLRFIHGVFFGPLATDLPRQPHEPPRWMRFPVELLVLLCLVVGIIPALSVGGILHTAVIGVLGSETPKYTLSLWHGFNMPLMMSIFALAGGIAVYLLMQRYLQLDSGKGPPLLRGLDGKRIFESAMTGLSRLANSVEDLLGSRRLQPQLTLLVLAALAAAAVPLWLGRVTFGEVRHSPIDPVFALLWVGGAVCAIGAAYQAKYHRLAALILMGGAGLMTCLTFIWFSAPDLALTQLTVEVVTVVLILLGLRWLPRRLEALRRRSDTGVAAQGRRVRDLAIAIAAGLGMSALAYAILSRPLPETMSRFFVEKALSEGGGTNVVNVILVDFRGFDTFGEITVLGVVALTIYALLRRFRPAPESIDVPEQQRRQRVFAADWPQPEAVDKATGYLMVPAIIMRMMFPIIAMLAIYFFMRGHNLPGGGFVAGLIMSVAIILQYMAGGTAWVEKRMNLHPQAWIGSGLLLAGFTGLGAWWFGHPFLTSSSPHPVLPLLGEVPLPSAFLFDLGVFLLVVGATTLILIALAHQSVRGHRVAPAFKTGRGN